MCSGQTSVLDRDHNPDLNSIPLPGAPAKRIETIVPREVFRPSSAPVLSDVLAICDGQVFHDAL